MSSDAKTQTQELNKTENTKLNPKRRGLGRGLNALFEDNESPLGSEEGGVAAQGVNTQANKDISGPKRQMMGVDQITPNPDQPRDTFKKEPLSELTQSISEHGVLQPLLVRPLEEPGKYEIIAGERRWRAAQEARHHEVPVIVLDLNDEQAYQVSMIENLQRENLDPIEEAKGYQRLVNDYSYTQEKLAQIVGKSRPHIANTLRLLNLPGKVQDLVVNGDLSMGHARALLGAQDPERLAKIVIEDKLSVRQTESLVAEDSGRQSDVSSQKSKKKAPEKDVSTIALEEDLSHVLGLRVNIDSKGKGQNGTLKISYQTLDQLDEVIARLRSSSANSPRLTH